MFSNEALGARRVVGVAREDVRPPPEEQCGGERDEEQKKMETEVQKDTDAAIKRIDEALKAKEVEIMQV